ncbi:hypothetical protein L484_008854 [Morus notabilis]|uniref:Uncharacterized protein n=1 Tax=Morus notabilis TaxID=981085 RepID=W9RR95_9ROSA|nr:hypothetical protein L484_008854 [Morus notabilis]
MANPPLLFTFYNFAVPQCPSIIPNADFNEVVADWFLERCAQKQDYMLNSMEMKIPKTRTISNVITANPTEEAAVTRSS